LLNFPTKITEKEGGVENAQRQEEAPQESEKAQVQKAQKEKKASHQTVRLK